MSAGPTGPPQSTPQRTGWRAAVWPDDPTLRTLALATLINTMGNGAYFTVSALYFTRVVGLRPAALGLALTVAGVFGVLSGVPMGRLADRRGPRRVLQLLVLAQGVLVLGFLPVQSFWPLVVVASLVAVVDRGGNAVRNGIIARISQDRDRVRTRAYLRAVTNVGISVGALLGGLALAFDTRPAYLSVFVLNTVTFFAIVPLLGRLPYVAPVQRDPTHSRAGVLRDKPFVAVTALSAVFAMHFGLIDIAVPLWVANRTSAPTWFVSVLLLVNTVAVTFFQVRLARGTDDVPTAARAFARAGVFIAAACAVFALAADEPLPVAVALLLLGAGLHVVGEMIGSAGQWGVQMGLAPSERQGEYQGFASTGFATSTLLAPVVLTLLCIEWGRPGWLVMGAVFALTAAAFVPVSRWALGSRERYGVTTHSG
ncbi:MAG TPA: MFS transporter [Actinomycetales bacterium]